MSPTNTNELGQVADAVRSQASSVAQPGRQFTGTLGVAVIGAVVLQLDPELPGRIGTAEAITADFVVAKGRRRVTMRA